jgi:hypothetical protein
MIKNNNWSLGLYSRLLNIFGGNKYEKDFMVCSFGKCQYRS